MAVKDILGIVVTSEAEGVLAAETALAKQWNARAALLHATIFPDPIADAYGYGGDLYAVAVTDAQKEGVAERAKLSARLRGTDTPIALRGIETMHAGADIKIALAAMTADIAIIESGDDPMRRLVLESVLFHSGRPILVVPPAWRGASIGKRILVAWAPKREAVRALADADDFLSGAEAVQVTAVDLSPNINGSESSAQAVTDFLAARGVKAALKMLQSKGRAHENVLMDEAKAFNADLIVMGGYGHSRFREFVFGGVTRAMSEGPPIPVLMAH